MTHWARLLGAVALLCAAGAAAAPQVREGASAPAVTASVAGTVFVGGETKSPARRVRVTLTDVTGTWPGRTTTTDDSGSFAFHGLPAGRFELQAFKPAYLRASYGAARPERAGTPIVLADGDTKAGLTMTLARGGVITGVVRDARGQPVPGVAARVLKLGYDPVTGEPRLGAASASSEVTTDDRGAYRAFGLPPGGYLVLLPGPPPGPYGRDDGIRVLTSREVRQAEQAARAGGVTPLPSPAALRSPAARVNYAPVFHPGVTDIGAATTVTLGLSEERRDVDVTVRLVPSATISGTISSPSGPLPPFISISIVPAGPHAEMLASAGPRGLSTQPDGGTYAVGRVPPGTYIVKARVGVAGGRGPTPLADAPTMWAAAEVVVDGQDLNVPLMLQPGVAMNGRVVFEGAQPTADQLQTLSFKLVPLGSGGTPLFSGGGRVDAEGRFSFRGAVPNTYRFTTAWSAPGAADRWTVKSATANGRDAFEAPLRVEPNVPVEWSVTFTDTPTSLAGVLQDSTGRPATDYYVMLFSADQANWTPGSRRVRTTRPATDGAFSIRGVPPGDYLVAALTDLEAGEWNDPALLDELVPSAVRLTLRDGETTRQDFRIGGPPGTRQR
jgi:hypothetical protein